MALTAVDAPMAPQNVPKPPPLDPGIIKRNSIMVPPPPSVPELQLKLRDALKKLYKSKIPKPPQTVHDLPPLPV